MIMMICNYDSIRSEQAKGDLLLLLKCFSSLKPPASFASTPYLYSKQYDFLFMRRGYCSGLGTGHNY